MLGSNRIGLRFTDMDAQERDSLIRRMFSPLTPGATTRARLFPHGRLSGTSPARCCACASAGASPSAGPGRMKTDISCTLDAGGVIVKGQIREISVIGARVFIPTLASLPPEVELQFSGANRGLIEIRAQTVRSALGDKQPPEFGLRFLKPRHIDPVVLEELEDAVSG